MSNRGSNEGSPHHTAVTFSPIDERRSERSSIITPLSKLTYTKEFDNRISLIDLIDKKNEHQDVELASQLSGTVVEDVKSAKAEEEDSVVKYGTFNGVFVRVCVSIFGVMLFLRMSWMVGYAGLGLSLVIVIMSLYVTIATTFSISALCTNGRVLAGGPYYLVSRSVGMEFGQMIGIIFSIAQSVAIGLNTVGFAEEVTKLYATPFTGYLNWDIVVVALLANVAIFAIALFGVGWVNKTNLILFIGILIGVLSFVIGSMYKKSGLFEGYTGYSGSVFVENFSPKFTSEVSFFVVTGVFFPAVTGITQGANMSGELKNPAYNIPVGTLAAIGFTSGVYVIVLFLVAATGTREALRNYESITYMVEVSVWGPLVYAGIFAATLSTALGLLIGAPRILVATLKDGMFPKLLPLAVLNKKGDPIRGYILVIIIATIVVIASGGKLNVIAPIVTNLYMVVYAVINFAVFLSSYAKTPGWRPGFKYYNKWHSLTGVATCIAFMFIVDIYVAFALIIFSFGVYIYVVYKKKTTQISIGGAMQAIAYIDAVKHLWKLEQAQEHVKNFRPQFITISNLSRDSTTLMKVVTLFYKGYSILIEGTVIVDKINKESIKKLQVEGKAIKLREMHVFPRVTIDKNLKSGIQHLLQTAGIGKLKPNTSVFEYRDDWYTMKTTELKLYVDMIRDSMRLEMGVMVIRNMQEWLNIGDQDRKTVTGYIDVYWLSDDGGLILLLGWLLVRYWKGCKMRVFTVEGSLKDLIKLLKIFRINAVPGELLIPEPVFKPSDDDEDVNIKELFNDEDDDISQEEIGEYHELVQYSKAIQVKAMEALVALITLPVPKVKQMPTSYMKILDQLSLVEIPCILAHGNNKNVFTPYL